MNLGAENRKKTIIAGLLGGPAVLGFMWVVYSNFFAGPSGNPPPTPPPSIIQNHASQTQDALSAPAGEKPGAAAGPNGAKANPILPTGNAAGVDTQVMAKASSSLDPTLQPGAMLRTEHLVYGGTGRNIFSASYTPPAPPVKIEKPIKPVRVVPCPPNCPPPAPPPPPPPPPPIPLKYFGVETLKSGARQAFLLNGEDVYMAGTGDIVMRRFKIVSVNAGSVQITDMSNNNTQTLPLQTQ